MTASPVTASPMPAASAAPMLEVENLEQRFTLRSGIIDRLTFEGGRPRLVDSVVHAVNGVSFSIAKGEVLALVGESGCGKSTVAKSIARIYTPSGGRIRIDGEEIGAYGHREMLPVRAKMQMIFQDPFASLNPRQKVRDIVAEPLREQLERRGEPQAKARAREAAIALLARVGLNAEHAGRYPHQFSGGQRQRIGIARALSVNPGLIIADEPVSALDVSIQAQILNLMMDLRDEYGLAYLFISHDLSVVNHIADRIGVMYLGFLVETAPRDRLFSAPRHPYTRALLSAAPTIDPADRAVEMELEGEVPSALALPSGCCFRTRCPFAFDRCAAERPRLQDVGGGQSAACHLIDEPERDRP
ncbi:ABC transporter ATP-binding protein [Salinarimonas sp. NSM]|uniref:ABC transporter ATP-binding protein n=1 Tax=Salinarimonas sp. NSM TaxID=3458003 RepID=UPI00403587E8